MKKYQVDILTPNDHSRTVPKSFGWPSKADRNCNSNKIIISTVLLGLKVYMCTCVCLMGVLLHVTLIHILASFIVPL